MNFYLQIIPSDDTIYPNPTTETLVEPISQNQPSKTLTKIAPKKKIATVDQKEKISWNPTEAKRYLKFLVQFQHLLELQKKAKRRLKLNVKMSKAIKTRDPGQCHSHHQKMLLKHGNIEGIIKHCQGLAQRNITNEKQNKKVQVMEEKEDHSKLQELAWEQNLPQSLQYCEIKQDQMVDIGLEIERQQSSFGNNWFDCLF